MRVPKAEWVAALKAVDPGADLRWNEAVGRWEFILTSADGVPRSQFWGRFFDQHGQRLPLDPSTGLAPFRDLDDDTMREVLANLERSFIGNRHDGAGSTRREMERRVRYNRDLLAGKYRKAGELFADMVAERGRRLRGGVLVGVTQDINEKGRT